MAAEITAEMFLRAFNTVGGDSSAAGTAAAGYATLGGWRASQTAQAAAAGAIAMAVPVAHLAALAGDFAVLLRKMAVCAWGIGYKLGAPVDAEDDLEIVLGLWSGALEPDALSVTAASAAGSAGLIAFNAAYPTYAQAVMAQVMTKGAHTGVAVVGGKLVGKSGGKVAAKLSKPFLQKIAQKVAVKFSMMLGSKAVTGSVPLLGALAGGAINAYFVRRFADAAETYYRAKLAHGNGPAGAAGVPVG
ncbi:hypothetical protein AB0O18_30260 [Streptomyces sp. NPDC093224]|uniref:hypothetical protein n=1 Tax=Streptomyces sp. NPDC093224 TaxID=3155198 RepID=UPI00342D9288